MRSHKITLTNDTWQQLGLLYEQTCSSVEKTSDPAGQLNVQRYLEGKSDCFDLLSITKQKKKKTLLVTAWMLMFKSDNYRRAHQSLRKTLKTLLKEGFELLVSTEQGLIKATNKDHLKQLISQFKPMSNQDAEAWAYENNLANGNFQILDAPTLHNVAQNTNFFEVYYHRPLDYPLFPIVINEEELAVLAEVMAPDEKVTLSIDNCSPLKIGNNPPAWLASYPLLNRLNQHLAGIIIDIPMRTKHINTMIELAPKLQSLSLNEESNTFQSANVMFNPNNLSSLDLQKVDMTNSSLHLDTMVDQPSQRYRMSWAMRLKRVFNIDITICRQCQGSMRIIACIEEKSVIDKILSHLSKKQILQENLAGIRGPPS